METYSEQVRADAKKAADYIRQHGWFQGDYESPDGCVCALGAIQTTQKEENDSCPLAEAFAKEVGLRDSFGVHIWNDAPGRTKEEVLAVFDRIANQ